MANVTIRAERIGDTLLIHAPGHTIYFGRIEDAQAFAQMILDLIASGEDRLDLL